MKRLKQSARWLRSWFVNGALILGYHRVTKVPSDPYSMCVTPQHFGEQLEVLCRYANPISLSELVQSVQDRRLPERAVVLTFDDGYADNLYNAKPFLEQHQVPATVFVATGYMGREFWWDELERLVMEPATLPDYLSLCINGGSYEWSLYDPVHLTVRKGALSPRGHLMWGLYKCLLPLSFLEREAVMARLWDWADSGSTNHFSHRAMNPDEITELARGGLVEVGAHTDTHPILNSLPAATQRSEISQSRVRLEEIVGAPVVSFSYPNGSASRHTQTLVREASFCCACSSLNDVTWHGSDLYRLPRFWIPDWDGVTFSRWLGKWL